MNQLDANNWLVFGTLVMAGATVISFIALIWNAYLFRKQLKIQTEQKDVMLKEVDSVIKQTDAVILQAQTMIDLRRKSIAPILDISNGHIPQVQYLIQRLFIKNKGDMLKWLTLKLLKEDGLLKPVNFHEIKFIDAGVSPSWFEFQLNKEIHDVQIEMKYSDMDGNVYTTIIGFKNEQERFIEVQPPTLITS